MSQHRGKKIGTLEVKLDRKKNRYTSVTVDVDLRFDISNGTFWAQYEGNWYSADTKAALSVQIKAAATKALWIYDLRTNQRFTLKERPMTRADLHDFVTRFRSGAAYKREESERFRKFPLEMLLVRDKLNLDMFCLKDDTLDDPDLLPPPNEVAAEVVESLEAALASFRSVAAKLQGV